MIKNLEEKIVTLKILGIAFGILAVIIIPLLIINNKKQNKENFPSYEEIDISQSIFNKDDNYDNIRDQLENDYYFAKTALMFTEYDYKKYNSGMLQDMVWHYMFNYELVNDDYFTSFSKKSATGCLNKSSVVNGFEELYNVDITDDIDYIKGYYKYVYQKGNEYCFYFQNVNDSYDNDILVAVDRMSIMGTTITTDVYVYEFYTSGLTSEENSKQKVKNAITNKNYNEASNIVTNELYGQVTHKQLQFQINKKGKFFKYKILKSILLNY